MKHSTRQSFIHGTMILLAAGMFNRILGFVPRIWLPRVIGAEGIGLYQMGYPFLIVVLTVITGGIPLAIAKLVAEAEAAGNERRVRAILAGSLLLSVSLGAAATLACVLGASWITTHLLTDARVYYTFLCMSPIILIVSVSSVLRGYFQGRHNMIPTATSQVAETIVRCIAQLAIAYALLPLGIVYAAAGAMAGVSIGELFGFLTLLAHYRRHRPDGQAAAPSPPESIGGNLRRMFAISLPVTLSRLVGSFSYFFEQVMIVQSLAIAGIAASAATARYGELQGMVIPVLLLPSALTYSLSVSLVPSLSDAAAKNDMRTIHKRLYQSLRLALVTGAPFAVVMFVLAEPLCYYLFRDAEVGFMLKMMAPVALFSYCQGPLQATLQALDKPGTALLNTAVGAVVKIALIYLLATRPEYGIYGAVMAINANIALVTLLHWNSAAKLLKFSLPPLDFVKIGAMMAVMGLACQFLMQEPWIGPAFLRFLASGFLGTLLFLAGTVGVGLVDRYDLIRVPLIGRWFAPKRRS